MLKSIEITNVALIERAEISFSEGLNVLSGETGAGKSVILDSIDFVLGAKADKSMIRYGQTQCFVRAEFSCRDERVFQILSDFDVDADDTLIISRKLNSEGKGAIKINGCSVSASMLRRITSLLVDVHGQSEHFFLLKESNQLSLLDRIAGEPAKEEKQLIGCLLRERQEILNLLDQLGGDEGERSRRMDILRYQIEEIKEIAPQPKEDELLTAQRNLFEHSEKILQALSSAKSAVMGDENGRGGQDSVSEARRALGSIVRYDEKYGALAERLEEVAAELQDIGACLDDYLDELDFDEEERSRVEIRLDEIRRLKKKYGGTLEEVAAFLAHAEEELALLESAAQRREELALKLHENDEELYRACRKLTELRKRTAECFTEEVTEELRSLNISSARFEIRFEDYGRESVGNATQTGLDKISFLFSANAGEPLKELNKIISGGEMSRFMLAVKARCAGAIGTCIFDEIDAGIGGKTAWTVAEKFCKISKETQVIAVSHLAQIAAFADRQFLIEKREENGKTNTRIVETTGEERRKEIARLIAGDASGLSLCQADELMGKANEFKNSL